MNIKIWTNFVKRKNSTKIPTNGTNKTVVLKNECTIDEPIFILNEPISNITYVQAFNNYYFVERVINLSNNLCELHCVKDRLATFKRVIGSYNAFVERSASNYDTLINDNLLSSSNEIVAMNSTQINMPTASNDIYVVPVFGAGGVLQYVFPNITDASLFFNQGSTITIAGESITKQDWLTALSNTGWVFAGSDITSYMGDMVFTPYLPPVQTPYITTQSVQYGYYSYNSPTNLNVLNPTYSYFKLTRDLTDPNNIYDDFRAYNNKFSQYKIYLPACGVVELNSADAGKKDLKIDILLDFLTFMVTYRIYHADGNTVAMFNGKFGTGVPAMGSNIDIVGATKDIANSVTSAVGFNFGATASDIVSVADRFVHPQINGVSAASGNGAVLKNFPHILYTVTNFESKDFPTTVAGRPTYENKTISNLSGFIKCGGASVPINGDDADRDIINSFLNNGFYYE